MCPLLLQWATTVRGDKTLQRIHRKRTDKLKDKKKKPVTQAPPITVPMNKSVQQGNAKVKIEIGIIIIITQSKR